MKKCLRCGKIHEDDIKKCDVCSYPFPLYEQIKVKKEDSNTNPSDLIDYPLLTFVFGLLSLLLPIYLFSFLAIKLSKKPCKESLLHFRQFGLILAYLGVIVTTFILGIIIFTFLKNKV